MDISEGHLIALEKQLLENNNIEFINLEPGKGTSFCSLLKILNNLMKIKLNINFFLGENERQQF